MMELILLILVLFVVLFFLVRSIDRDEAALHEEAKQAQAIRLSDDNDKWDARHGQN